MFSWGRYPPGRLLPMWPPSMRHSLYSANLSNLQSQLSGYMLFRHCLFHRRHALLRCWRFYDDVFGFLSLLIGLKDLTVVTRGDADINTCPMETFEHRSTSAEPHSDVQPTSGARLLPFLENPVLEFRNPDYALLLPKCCDREAIWASGCSNDIVQNQVHVYLTFLHPLYMQLSVLLAYCESISMSGILLSSFSGLKFWKYL